MQRSAFRFCLSSLLEKQDKQKEPCRFFAKRYGFYVFFQGVKSYGTLEKIGLKISFISLYAKNSRKQGERERIMTADFILISESVFAAEGNVPFSGYVAVRGERILACGPGQVPASLVGPDTKITDLGDRTVLPGFSDVHCFFTGWAAEQKGIDPEDRAARDAMLSDRDYILPKFRSYMQLMNSRGVTSVKEMGFDDFSGFPDLLSDLEKNGELTLRVHFMSQPVNAPMDLAFGRACAGRFTGDFLRFSGFNRMTDGSISQLEGEMKAPYLCAPDSCCRLSIDWDRIAEDTRAADREGFRFSLHAQGDAAISKVADILETCRRDEDGRLVNRHSVTDLECSDPADLDRLGRIGAVAEIYPQIQSIADREGKLAMIAEKIGSERGKNYWNRRRMADAGMILSCGTDLPLLIDDIPQSVYHAVGGYFPEGGEPFNAGNMLKTGELLRAWTYGGAYNLYREQEFGTLAEGKKADITVLTGNVFAVPAEQARSLKVAETLVSGKTVYRAE